jgi:hypothetical protein
MQIHQESISYAVARCSKEFQKLLEKFFAEKTLTKSEYLDVQNLILNHTRLHHSLLELFNSLVIIMINNFDTNNHIFPFLVKRPSKLAKSEKYFSTRWVVHAISSSNRQYNFILKSYFRKFKTKLKCNFPRPQQ